MITYTCDKCEKKSCYIDFILKEVLNIVDNPYELLLYKYPYVNGIVHLLDPKQYSSISKDMNDIIILEEGIEVILTDRNQCQIYLTIEDLKYVPLYALRNTRVSINTKNKKDIKVITFNAYNASILITNFTENLIKFEDGVAYRC